jgi:hypothetical protein
MQLYLLVCDFYDTQPDLKYQRLSNFKPRCIDQELLTMHLFGHLQGMQQQRRIHEYVHCHWHAWFSALPGYQAFNRRLNELICAFEQFISSALESSVARLSSNADRRIDSMPMMIAKGGSMYVRRRVCSYIAMANWLWLVCS